MSFTDFHTHVLPGIDDGCKSRAEALALLRKQAEQGVRRVVATPHFYPSRDTPERFLKRREAAEAALRKSMQDEEGLPELLMGAEIYFFEGISDCEFLREMAIENTTCVMIEMPMHAWSDRNLQELCGIRQKLKLTPIIAHLDRYLHLPPMRGIHERLAKLPLYVQVNADYFSGVLQKRRALSLFREGKIHLLGSDAHNLTDRAPNLDAAIRALQKAAPAALERLRHREERIFSGERT